MNWNGVAGLTLPLDGPAGVLLPLHAAEERLPLRAQGGPAPFYTDIIPRFLFPLSNDIVQC